MQSSWWNQEEDEPEQSLQASIPPFSKRLCEHCSPTWTMLECFSPVSSVVFYLFFKDPIEDLSKFPCDSKPQGGDDSTSQHAQAGQEGFSRLVHLSGKFAVITSW